MSSKPKFSKLQLPKSSRLKTKSQISKFFSTSNTDECSTSLVSQLPTTSLSQILTNSNENSTSSCSTNDIILIVSDDEEDYSQLKTSELSTSTKFDLVQEELPTTIIKSDSKTEHLARNTVISKFLNNTGNEGDSDFENLPVKSNPIKITKPKTKSKSIPKRKRQTTIKNAFVKNEEIFSDLMAQHSIADNINPDELQMALAISLSEATANGMYLDDDSKESLACCSGNKIRDRLQEYGFKTSGNSADYDVSYFLPGKNKSKWANKFTSLTLRNPEKQNKKLHNKIQYFLNQHELNETNTINEINKDFLISSNYLNKLKSDNGSIKLECGNMEHDCIAMFYVNELFEPTTAKAGHLMKDLNEIPGRDFSPKKNNVEHKIEKIINDNFESEEITTVENKNINISDIGSSFESNDINLKLIESENGRMSKSLSIGLEIEADLLSPDPKKIKRGTKTEPFPIKLDDDEIEVRLSSPDLFADFEMNRSKDESLITSESAHKSYKNSSHLETNFKTNVAIFENFSSDEVKTSSHDVFDKTVEAGFTKNDSNNLSTTNTTTVSASFVDDQLIDLTQDVEYINSNSNSISLRKSFENSINSQANDLTDDCILLSDDEVNYSIKISNKTNYNKNIDLTLSSCSETEEEREIQLSAENYDKTNINNFSFINLIEDNTNYNNDVILSINENMNLQDNKNTSCLEYLENGEITPSQSAFNSQSSLNESSPTKIIQNTNFQNMRLSSSVCEFIGPTKITPTKLFKNQSRFIKNNSTPETITCNLSKLLTNTPTLDSVCNKIPQSDSEDDDTSFDLTKLRAKYGIKENKRTTINCRKALSESFISPKPNNNDVLKLKNVSSSVKFKEFIEPTSDDEYFSDVDEIDKLVYNCQFKTSIFNKPKGIENLLSADVITNPISSISKDCCISPKSSINVQAKEVINNGRVYLINTENIPEKPDYKRMDSPTRLKQLYKYGLKPLKKKQAVIMLEYIYNQTHPIIVNNNSQESLENFTQENRILINEQNNIVNIEIEKNNQIPNKQKFDNFNLKDCIGTKLLEDDGFMFGENKNDMVIFQTNISKKISTALLPLHLAWYNLIKSNYRLKESILHYEPVDLQEIYLFFKKIGYRYDPKDIKKFFDYHCIIFRYDLNQDTNVNRHIRQNKSSFSQNKNKKKYDWML